jgi:hypothetical protein
MIRILDLDRAHLLLRPQCGAAIVVLAGCTRVFFSDASFWSFVLSMLECLSVSSGHIGLAGRLTGWGCSLPVTI